MVPFAIDAFVGVTEMDVNAGGVTVSAAEPLIVPDVAVIVAVPGIAPVARPPVTLATEGMDELQLTVFVKFCVVPSL